MMKVDYNVKRSMELLSMSNQEPGKKPLTELDLIDFEKARDRINEYKCYWAREKVKERMKDSPDLERIAALGDYIAELDREHKAMTLSKPELFQKSKYIYRTILKALTSRSDK